MLIVIIGAGLAGLSASYHIGHDGCVIYEKNGYLGGHIHSYTKGGFLWDEGPHVSFTKNDYVRELFAKSVDYQFVDLDITTTNHYYGHWIEHPVQSHLFQVPEPSRGECLADLLKTRRQEINPAAEPMDYKEWLERAFGPRFTELFPAQYTRKYWTVDPELLTTDWIGNRIFLPNIEDIVAGANGAPRRKTHYITHARYPLFGGYQTYSDILADGANIVYNEEVQRISLKSKQLWLSTGKMVNYDKLISTMPLPLFIKACIEAPKRVLEAGDSLSCSQLLLVNVVAPHETQRTEHWIYVYDQDKLSTRINMPENLSAHQARPGFTGIQVEVYSSKYKPLTFSHDEVAQQVISELIDMGLILSGVERHAIKYHTRFVPWANIIFDHSHKQALNTILSWLERYSLIRHGDDLHPMTDWAKFPGHNAKDLPDLALAGRFGEWKYYWSDDCVLTGKRFNN